MCILLLWQKTATVFNIQQVLYSLGNMTITLLSRQYLTSTGEDDDHRHLLNLTSHQTLNPSVSAFIYWPYFMGSVLKFVVCMPFLVLSVIPKPKEIQEQFTKRHTKGSNSYNWTVLYEDKSKLNNYFMVFVLLYTSEFLLGACHAGFMQYTFITAVKLKNGFNQKDAALLNSVISGVSSISPLLASLTAYYIPVRILTLSLAFSAVLPDVLLLAFGIQSYKMFWTFVTLKAFLLSPSDPLSVPYIDSYIELSGGLLSMLEAVHFSGSITQYFINGNLLEYTSVWTLLVFGLILTVFIFITQFCAFLASGTGCRNGPEHKFMKEEKQEKLLEQ